MTPPHHSTGTTGLFGHSASALPPWARILLTVGVLPAIAIYLIWIMSTRVAGTLDSVNNTLKDHHNQAIQIEHKVDEELVNHRISNSLLRQICVSLAKTPVDRRECAR